MANKTVFYISYESLKKQSQNAYVGADDTDLAILGAAVLLADESGMLSLSALEEGGRFEAADIRASVKFWCGAGVISSEACPCAQSTQEPAHKGGAITHTSVEKYTNDELSRVLSGGVSPDFVDEAQKAMGKMFNSGEVGKLVGLVDQLGFAEEAVLAILSYCVRLGKKSLSYAEKIAVSFHDEDIVSAEDVHAQIDYLERKSTATEKVRSLFGFGSRALSSTEKKLFGKWTVDYGYDIEIITLAYEMTVDAIQSPSPKYTDAIITKWHNAGLTALAEVKAFAEEERSRIASKPASVDSKGKNSAKNAEIDEWFEKRLQIGLK